jgi:tryptophanyl-tRNA synthetase
LENVLAVATDFSAIRYPISGIKGENILIYDASLVPVGKDQKQHVEA